MHLFAKLYIRCYLLMASMELKRAVGWFCAHIRRALHRAWILPEERKNQAEAAALQCACDETKRQQAEVKRREKGEVQLRRQVEAERKAEEAERKKEEEQRRRDEAKAKHHADKEGWQAEPRPPDRQRPQRALLIGSLAGLVLLGAIGGALSLTAPPPSELVTPSPTPIAPRPPATMTPAADTPLSPQQEQALKSGESFNECTNCPLMIVIPAGSFMMGSPAGEGDNDEHPQHRVTIAVPFAVSKFELTFDDWDACVADGGCDGYKPSDDGWGRSRRPVIDVSWNDAAAYVAWLVKKTGKPYRLLSESEYEYATRGGTTTAYPWGDDIGKNKANCNGCGSQWGGKETAPVGSIAPNQFGLYDMVGNVWEWTQDCSEISYNGAPTDGSAWTGGDCLSRVLRGGAWAYSPSYLRSAARNWAHPEDRGDRFGFRVGRTLLSP